MGFSKSPMDFSKDKAVRMQLRTATYSKAGASFGTTHWI
jgi:hypothetical protein